MIKSFEFNKSSVSHNLNTPYRCKQFRRIIRPIVDQEISINLPRPVFLRSCTVYAVVRQPRLDDVGLVIRQTDHTRRLTVLALDSES